MSTTTGVLAAMRDASLYSSPGTARCYHVVVDGPADDAGEPRRVAACNRLDEMRRGAMPLDLDAARDAIHIPGILRCRRRPCADRWPSDTGSNGERRGQ